MTENELFLKENLPFWDNLSDSEKSLLFVSSSSMKYEKGSHIHTADNECAGLMLIKKGHIRVYMLSESGREITLYRLFDKDICIMSAACVISTITFDVFIDAEASSEIILINSSAFNNIMNNNIYVEAFSYKLATSRFSDVMWAMQQILFMSADKRLAIFLTDEISKTSSDTINLTHEQIAKYMGSAREVVSRLLKYFANEGIVSLSRGGIKILDKKRLRALTTNNRI